MLFKWRRWRRAVGFLLGLLAVYAGGFGVFLVLLPEPYVSLPPMDGLAVFTGGSNRVVSAVQAVADGFAGPVLVSGVHPDVRLRELPGVAGLDDGQRARLTLDTLAVTTRDNVVNTLMWADVHKVKRLGVMTSTYHTLRCRLLFWWYGAADRVVMLPVQPSEAGVWPLLREYNKLLVLPLVK